MHHVSTFLLCLIGSLVVAGCEGPSTGGASPAELNSIDRPSDPEFVREVYDSDLPVLVDFSATWCGPCRQLEPMLHRIEREYEGRLKVVTIDVDEERSLAAHYKVESIPALYLFNQGELIAMNVGLPPSQADLLQWVETNVELPAEAAAPVDEAQAEDAAESTET